MNANYMEDIIQLIDFAVNILNDKIPSFQQTHFERYDKENLFHRFAQDIIFGLIHGQKYVKNSIIKEKIHKLSKVTKDEISKRQEQILLKSPNFDTKIE